MDLSNLRPAKGSVKTGKRRGRGVGSGSGRTASRGHKGASSRSGYKRKRAFEGGQMPLQMRLPKIGFKSPNRVEYVGLNLERLQRIVDKYGVTEITPENLYGLGIIRKNDRVKILGNGTLTSALTVRASKFSEKASEGIRAAGGSFEVV